ncbi:MAG: cobalt-precorrin 5A hydrolase [Flexilinea sp.]|nr:cobalt-precorrin 5A hydrolase [Flexilinea sp.]
MKIAIFCYSKKAKSSAERIALCFGQDEMRMFSPARLSDERFHMIPMPSISFYGEQFDWADAMIFIGACGIAVRAIAPHVRSKVTDPAVLCIDEMAQYVIPILSGHIGGANDLTRKIASDLGALPVITTATDINGRFSVDSWAVENRFVIDNMSLAKEVSATILEHDIPFSSMLAISTELPDGLVRSDSGELGIFIGWEKREPYAHTLRLIPPVLHLGIGCKRGTAAETIRKAVSEMLERYNIDSRAIRCAASIDLKADEPGLREYLQNTGLRSEFYSAERLQAVPGEFSRSDFVMKVTGVDNVCERAAMVGADQLIVPKTVFSGVTLALAAETKEVRF